MFSSTLLQAYLGQCQVSTSLSITSVFTHVLGQFNINTQDICMTLLIVVKALGTMCSAELSSLQVCENVKLACHSNAHKVTHVENVTGAQSW